MGLPLLFTSLTVQEYKPLFIVLTDKQPDKKPPGQSDKREHGSRALRPQDISAPIHFGTNFKPNHRWSCVLSVGVQSVPTFRQSDAEVSRTTFLMQKCLLETVPKCFVRVRSVLVVGAEVPSGRSVG